MYEIILKVVIVPVNQTARDFQSMKTTTLYRVTFQVSYLKKNRRSVRHNFAGARCRPHCGWNFLSSLARSMDLYFFFYRNHNRAYAYKLFLKKRVIFTFPYPCLIKLLSKKYLYRSNFLRKTESMFCKRKVFRNEKNK